VTPLQKVVVNRLGNYPTAYKADDLVPWYDASSMALIAMCAEHCAVRTYMKHEFEDVGWEDFIGQPSRFRQRTRVVHGKRWKRWEPSPDAQQGLSMRSSTTAELGYSYRKPVRN
jgi:hypothetical protein